MPDIKLPYGLKDGVIIHISQAVQGLGCACVCPSCKEPLVARKGSVMAHHFAHYGGTQCESAVETALHLASKQMLSERREIRLPAVEIKFNTYRDPMLVAPEQNYQLDEVREEYHTGTVVPDILAFVGGTPLMIEIKVTHAVDEAKLAKIRDLGISVLEIDLSGTCRDFSPEQLAKSLVEETSNKKWLFNTRVEKLKTLLFQTGEKKRIITRRVAQHVDYCPINIRTWRGKSYANVIDDCIYCKYSLDAPLGGAPILCGGRHKITTLKQLCEFHNRTESA